MFFVLLRHLCLCILFCVSTDCLLANTLVEAARQREVKFKNLTLEYTLSEVVSRGAVSNDAGSMFKGDVHVPTRETVLNSTNRLDMRGELVRFQYSHPLFLLPQGNLSQHQMISYFNGKQAKTYYPEGRAGQPTPSGILENSQHDGVLRYTWHYPLVYHFRATSSRMNVFPLTNFQPVGIKVVIDGTECEEYNLPSKSSSGVKFWITSGKDALLRRVRSDRNGKVNYQTDIKYRDDTNLGWVIASWTHNKFDGSGNLAHALTAQVTSVAGSGNLADSDFDIVFPEGCLVYDQQTNTHYRAKSNGAMRELDSNGNELDTVVFQPDTPWYQRNLWLLIALGVALLGTVVFLGKRLRSTKAA